MNHQTEYLETATMAAKLEKIGDFAQAAHFWRAAQYLAKNAANEDWCWIRARLCEMKSGG